MDYIDLTPIMTSDTLPSPYVASSSSVYGSGYYAYQAFDSNVSTPFVTGGGDSGGWVMLDFSKQTKVNKIEIHGATEGWSTDGISFEGSNNGTSFDYIGGIDEGMLPNEIYSIEFETVKYRYFRAKFKKSYSYTGVGWIKFYYNGVLDEEIPDVSHLNASLAYSIPMNTTQAILAKTNDTREGLLGMANDAENYGDLYVVGKDGRAHLTKSGIKSKVIFEGNATVSGTYQLTEDISKYKFLAVDCMCGWSGYTDALSHSVFIDVSTIKHVPFEHICNFSASSSQRTMCFNFNSDKTSFTINEYILGNITYMKIVKIIGIY